MSLVQAKRISYTRRDLLSIHPDVTLYIKEFVTRITDASEMNTGRLFLTIIEALVDNANFSIDQIHLEGQLDKARQRKNILRLARLVGYQPSSVSAASVDLTFTLLSGVAPVGGVSIPIDTRVQTTVAPVVEFVTTAAATILEGTSTITVAASQGVVVSGEVLTSAASGDPNQRYTITNPRTPHSFIEVRVDGKLWTSDTDFADADEESEVYRLEFDEDDFTEVIFGDDEFGKTPSIGSSVIVDYIQTEAEDGNAPANTIQQVVGTLASTVGVDNDEGASGGAPSESNDSIRRQAPASFRSFLRAVTKDDYEAQSTEEAGVFKAFAIATEGARTDVFLLPEGGGVASSSLITQVQQKLNERKVEGAVAVVQSLQEAGISISVNVVAFSSKIAKATIKKKIVDETNTQLNYTKLTRGRAFTRSDLDGIYEAIDDGTLVDYVDFTILTRIPRIVKSNASAPDFVGRVQLTSLVDYDEYLVTAISTTQFSTSKNGAPQTVNGTVAVEFTTDLGEISFTLGESGDTFTVGDTWRFKTSRYVDNIVIDDEEVMTLERDSDLIVSVYFPGEYDVKTKTAVA
jgi:hypothetical protein